jgi:16S rRNA processing protein RimM
MSQDYVQDLAPQGSGEKDHSSEPRFLAVGRILRPHGLRGELRVEIHTDHPERFALLKHVYLAPTQAGLGPGGLMSAATGTRYVLESHRFHSKWVLLKLAGVNDRTQAEALRELWVWIAPEQAAPLDQGDIYLHEMLDLAVITDEGEALGRVVQIIETGANPVYVVRGLRGEILIPDTDEVILDVDLAAQQMIVHLIAGLR